eukprot:g24938.t1
MGRQFSQSQYIGISTGSCIKCLMIQKIEAVISFKKEAEHQLSYTSSYLPLDHDPTMTHHAIVSITVRGVTMDTHMGPSYACLFMGHVE